MRRADGRCVHTTDPDGDLSSAGARGLLDATDGAGVVTAGGGLIVDAPGVEDVDGELPPGDSEIGPLAAGLDVDVDVDAVCVVDG